MFVVKYKIDHRINLLDNSTNFYLQAANRDYFSQYVTEDFAKYVNRKRQEFTHGNHIEVQAMSEMYNRSIEVFCYGKGSVPNDN